MIKLRSFDEILEVLLSDQEKAAKSEQLSKLIIERRMLKAEAKRQAENFASKIKISDQEIENLASVIDDGREFRTVTCKEQFTESGIEIEIIRTDTGEIVRTRALTTEERQEDLFPDLQKKTDELIEAMDGLIQKQEADKNAANVAEFFGHCECGHQKKHHSEEGQCLTLIGEIDPIACDCAGYAVSQPTTEEQQATDEEDRATEADREKLSREAIARWRRDPEQGPDPGLNCICGDPLSDHTESGGCMLAACDCQQFQEQQVAATANSDGPQGTPTQTARMVTEIDALAKLDQSGAVALQSQKIKRAYVDGNPYLVTGHSGTPERAVDEVYAWPVLPWEIAGSHEGGQFSVLPNGDDYYRVRFNCGSKKKPELWVVVGPRVVLTVEQTKASAVIEEDFCTDYPDDDIEAIVAADPCVSCTHDWIEHKNNGQGCARCNCASFSDTADDFTAPRCTECGRIEGAHAETCSQSSKFTYATYLSFARAQKLKNPMSHARKMELTRSRDDEVRAWLESQQGAPGDGQLFDVEPESKPQPKRRGRLALIEENAYTEGL
jgi:hypothetical protein